MKKGKFSVWPANKAMQRQTRLFFLLTITIPDSSPPTQEQIVGGLRALK
jgi:hypothetical protein